MTVGFVLLLVAGEPGVDLPFRGNGGILYEGPVDFPGISFSEGCRETGQGLGSLGQYDGSADRAVEAVGNSEEDVAWLAVTEGDECLELLCQRLVAGLVALDYLARTLVQDQYVVVLIEDTGGDVLRFLLRQCPVGLPGGSLLANTALRHWGNRRI